MLPLKKELSKWLEGEACLHNPHYPKVRQDKGRIGLPSPGSGKAGCRTTRYKGIIAYVKFGKR